MGDRSSETIKGDRSFVLGDRSSETRKGDRSFLLKHRNSYNNRSVWYLV
jgi:hypothetical protein